jgi:DNA-binding LytR/AlgR family response regulator
MAALYALFWVVVPLHAGFAAAVDIGFSPRLDPSDWLRVLVARAPVDMLVFLALGGFVVALRAQRRAAAESRRAAALEDALEGARRTLAQALDAPDPASRLMVSVGSRRVVVEAGEVEWFASAGNYVVVNWNGRDGLIRDTLSGLEARLDASVFARSHRSTLVNLAKVRDASSLSDGSWRLTTESGGELVVSRTYRDEILRRLGRG